MFEAFKKAMSDLESLTEKAAASQSAADAAKVEADKDTEAVQAAAIQLRDWLNKTFGLN